MKNKDKGRLPPFVPLLKDTMDSPAWRAMSHGAQALYIALKRRYNMQAHNNGRLYLSHRKAIEEIRSSSNQITRWFRELQYYGFIVMMSRGYLGIYGKGQAPRWRLTEIGCMKEPPTRDFMRWNGVQFSEKKKQDPAAEIRSRVQRKSAPVVQRKSAPLHGTSAAEIRSKGNGQSAAEIRCKSSKPLGWCVGGAVTEEEATNLILPPLTEPKDTLQLRLMTPIEGSKSNTAQVEEMPKVCAQCGGSDEILFQFKTPGRGRVPVWLHRRCRRYWLQARGVAS